MKLIRTKSSLLGALFLFLAVTFASVEPLHAEDAYHYRIFYRDIANFAAGNQPYSTPMPLYHTKQEAEKAAKDLIADLQKKATAGIRYTYSIEKEKAH